MIEDISLGMLSVGIVRFATKTDDAIGIRIVSKVVGGGRESVWEVHLGRLISTVETGECLAKNNGFQANWKQWFPSQLETRIEVEMTCMGRIWLLQHHKTSNKLQYTWAELPIPLTVVKTISVKGEDGDRLPHGVEPLKTHKM